MLRRLKIIFHYFRADAAMRRDQFDRAEELLSKVLELESDNPIAYHDQGVAQQGMGNYRAAIADFDKAIAIAPRLATAMAAVVFPGSYWEISIAPLRMSLRPLRCHRVLQPPIRSLALPISASVISTAPSAA